MADLNVGDTGPVIQIYPSYTQSSTTVVAPGSATITVPSTANPLYQIGLTLLCEGGTANAETVTITAVPSSTTFTATFTRSHGPNPWSISGGLIPSGATVGVAFKGRTTSTRYPTSAGTYATASSQGGGVYAQYAVQGTEFTVGDTYDIALNTTGSGYNITSVSESGPIVVQARL